MQSSQMKKMANLKRQKNSCPKCGSKLRVVSVKVQGALSKAKSYQCGTCDFFEFESSTSKKVLEELRETPLNIKQKIIKLSKDRLGIYFNQNIVRSLNLKNGEEILVSVPDKKHIILSLR
jgi:ribosomal protein S27AE